LHCDVYRQKYLKLLYSPIRKLLLNRADNVVVASGALTKMAIRMGASENKISVISFSVKGSDFQYTEGKYVLFIGRLVKYKGLEDLIDTCHFLGIPLKIVGDGPESIYLRTKSEGLSDIEFLGSVSESEKWDLIKNCRFGVLPSINSSETFGIFSLECLSQGKPMITTRVGTATDHVNVNEITGLVIAPGDRSGLRSAVSLLWSDQNLCEFFGRNASGKAQTDHLEDQVNVKYARLLGMGSDTLHTSSATNVEKSVFRTP